MNRHPHCNQARAFLTTPAALADLQHHAARAVWVLGNQRLSAAAVRRL